MIDPLVTLLVLGLALLTVSRMIPDEYDRRAVRARRRQTPPKA